MLHIVVDENEGTYSVCDGLPEVAKNSKYKVPNLVRIFNKKKRNLDKKGVKILRVPEKNTTYRIDMEITTRRKKG